MDEGDECGICCENKLENEYVYAKPCEHKICESCLKKVNRIPHPYEKGKTILPCPYCRTPIDIAIRKQEIKINKKESPKKPHLTIDIIADIFREIMEEKKEKNKINCNEIYNEIKNEIIASKYNERYEIDDNVILAECNKLTKNGGKKRRTKRIRTNKKKTTKKRKRFNKITK